ncbi:hypothetical protein GCM10027168_26380 [Streptomyces capparidis]
MAGVIAAYRRTNLTMRRIAPLFGVSESAADRILDHLGPMPALQARKRFAKDDPDAGGSGVPEAPGGEPALAVRRYPRRSVPGGSAPALPEGVPSFQA